MYERNDSQQKNPADPKRRLRLRQGLLIKALGLRMKKIVIFIILIIFHSIGIAGEIKCDDEYEEILIRYKALMKMSDEYGRPAYTRGDIQNFQQKLKQIQSICQTHINIEILSIDVLLMLGDKETAKSSVEELIAEHPNNANVYSTASIVMATFGDIEKQITYLRKAVSLEPTSDAFQINLCSTLENAKKYQEAIFECSKCIEKNGKHTANAYFIRARAYSGLGEDKHAQSDFETAKKLGSDAAKYYSDEHY